jgi:hypothetical protein
MSLTMGHANTTTGAAAPGLLLGFTFAADTTVRASRRITGSLASAYAVEVIQFADPNPAASATGAQSLGAPTQAGSGTEHIGGAGASGLMAVGQVGTGSGGSTNLFSFPEAIDNADWGKVRASVSADAIVAPDGNTTADKLIEDSTASNSHYFRKQLSLTPTTQYTHSVFAKAGERNWVVIGSNAGGTPSTGGVYFNLATGEVGTVGGGVDDHGIEDWGDGWYRCWVVDTSSGTGVWNFDTAMANGDGGGAYSGDGSSGAYFWGEYANIGAAPEDYPGLSMGPAGTGASSLQSPGQAGSGQETLAATGALMLLAPNQAGAGQQSIAGAAVQMLMAPGQAGSGQERIAGTGAQALTALTQIGIGAMTISLTGAAADGSDITYSGESVAPASGGSRQVVFSADDGTEDNYETLYRDANDDLIFEYRADGGTVYLCNAGTVGDGETFAWAVRASDNDFALVLDGWPPSHNLLGQRPIVDTLRIGSDLNGNVWGGTVGEIAIAEEALSDAVMEAATRDWTENNRYFVDPDASGANDGTSEADAWNGVAEIKAFITATGFAAGDRVSFKRGFDYLDLSTGASGIVWGVSGTRRQPFIVDAYGTGADPRFFVLGQDIQASLGAFSAGASGRWKRAYAGTTLNGFWEDNIRLTEAASISALTAGTWFWDKDNDDPDNESLGAGIWYMPTSGVPNDHYLARGLDKSAFQFNDPGYVIVRDQDIRESPQGIWVRGGGGPAAHHVVAEDCAFVGTQTGFHAGGGTAAGHHHITVRRCALSGCIIPAIWEVSNGAIEMPWNSVYDCDFGQADFDDIITKHVIKRTGSAGDHEIVSGQNMSHFRCFRNTLDLRLNVSQTVPWDLLALWIDSLTPSAMDDVQWTRNFFAGSQRFGVGFGAGSADSVTKNGRSWANIYLDCAVAEKFNINNTTPGNETITAHNIYHNCGIDIELAFGNGVIAKSHLHSGTNDTYIKSTQAHGNNEFDFNGYADAATGTPFHLNGSDLSFADWKTATGEDANSYDTTPTYAGGADPATAAGFKQTAASDSLGKGVAVDGILKDFDGLPFGANLLGAFALAQIAATSAQVLAEITQAGAGDSTAGSAGAGTSGLMAPGQTGSGAEALAATGVQVLAAPAQAGAGQEEITGAAAQMLLAPGQAASGATGAAVGTGAQMLAIPAQAGTGAVETAGSGAQTLALAAQAGAGQEAVAGAGAQMLAAPTQAASAGEIIGGAGSQALGAVLQAALGLERFQGAGAQVLGAVAQAAAGREIAAGAGAQGLPAPIQAAAGAEGLASAGAQALAAAAQAGLGREEIGGAGAQMLAAVTLVAAGSLPGTLLPGTAAAGDGGASAAAGGTGPGAVAGCAGPGALAA